MADTSYKGSHVAPNAETYGATLDNLSGIMPADVYSSKGIRLYGINDPAIDREWFAAAYRAKNKPDAEITIWRAVPKGVKDINSGDWVTTSQTYAKNHGENTLNGEYDLISSKVKANTLSSEGYPYEFGYNAPTSKTNETPLTSVKDISEKWNNQGVNLDVYASKDGSKINLSKIVIDPKQRSQGIGSQVMNDIIQQADNTNAIVTLSPSVDFGGTSVARLKNFYKEFGFVENKGRNKDLSISETMYRKPVQTLPTRKDLLTQEFDKLEK
jgi:GNAT superfamily N-acetyltransferase